MKRSRRKKIKKLKQKFAHSYLGIGWQDLVSCGQTVYSCILGGGKMVWCNFNNCLVLSIPGHWGRGANWITLAVKGGVNDI